jgi:hypothetical protein
MIFLVIERRKLSHRATVHCRYTKREGKREGEWGCQLNPGTLVAPKKPTAMRIRWSVGAKTIKDWLRRVYGAEG